MMQKLELCTLLVECKIVTMENHLAVPQRVNIKLSYDPAITLAVNGTQTDLCMPMFIIALFTKPARWKQANCLTHKSNKCICNDYSAIKKNQVLIRAII